MNKRAQTEIIFWIVIAIIVIGAGIYFYNEQKTMTANAINNLEGQLEEQNQKLEEQTDLTAEQQAQAEAEKERLASQIEELSKKTCKDVQVPYDAEEEYTEQEPYLKTEEYTEQEPYTVEECEAIELAYNKNEGDCTQYEDNFFSDDDPATYSYTVNNLDVEEGGTFVVDIGFKIDDQIVKDEQSRYIHPQSSYTFYNEKMAEIESCYFTIKTIPTKQECETVTKYRDVVKTREVTDYREVTKTRTVTKYKTETVCE